MLVIAKKKILFRMEPRKVPRDADGKPKPISSLAELSKARTHLVEASTLPQDVPEWVGQTWAFRHAAQDGSIMQIKVVTVEKPVTSFETMALETEEEEDDLAADRDPEIIDERHVRFINSRGYDVENPDEAKAFIGRMKASERVSYFADFEKAVAAAQVTRAKQLADANVKAARHEDEDEDERQARAKKLDDDEDPLIIDERHVMFLQSRGEKVATVEKAKTIIAAMKPKQRVQYFADFEKDQEKQAAARPSPARP
jgi:hypothetical protein